VATIGIRSFFPCLARQPLTPRYASELSLDGSHRILSPLPRRCAWSICMQGVVRNGSRADALDIRPLLLTKRDHHLSTSSLTLLGGCSQGAFLSVEFGVQTNRSRQFRTCPQNQEYWTRSKSGTELPPAGYHCRNAFPNDPRLTTLCMECVFGSKPGKRA